MHKISAMAMVVLDTTNGIIHTCTDAVDWAGSAFAPCPLRECLPRLVAAHSHDVMALVGWSGPDVMLWMHSAPDPPVLVTWQEPGPRPSQVRLDANGRVALVVTPAWGGIEAYCMTTGTRLWTWDPLPLLGECTVWDLTPFRVGWAVAVTRPLTTSMSVYMVSKDFSASEESPVVPDDSTFILSMEECATMRGLCFSRAFGYTVIDDMLMQLALSG
jgi:hypothetical protein